MATTMDQLQHRQARPSTTIRGMAKINSMAMAKVMGMATAKVMAGGRKISSLTAHEEFKEF